MPKGSRVREYGLGYKNKLGLGERGLLKLNYEKAVVYDSKGNIIFEYTEYKPDEIQFSKEQLKQMEGQTLTHNHPDGSTFSTDDVELLLNNNIYCIRATSEVHTFQLVRIKGTEPDKGIVEAYGKECKRLREKSNEIISKAEKDRDALIIKPAELDRIVNREVMKYNEDRIKWFKKNAKKYGLKFSVI